MPSRRSLPPGLGIIRSRTGSGANRRALRSSRSSARNASSPAARSTCRPSARRPRPSVRPCCPAPDPTPPAGTPGQQTRLNRSSNRRSGSSVAHWCSLVWIPSTRASASIERRPRRAGIHRRPPGLPVPPLRTRCRPFAMWPAFPTSDYYGGSAPSRAISRRRACPPPAWLAGGEGDPGTVPTFTIAPVDGVGAQLFPCSLATGTPQTFPVASRPATSHRPRSRPPSTSGGRALLPGPDPPGWSRCHRLRGFHRWFLTYTFPSRLPDPGRLAVPTRPVVVRAAPTLPRASRVRLPPASPACCDSPAVGPFTPPGHMAPRGAPPHQPSSTRSRPRQGRAVEGLPFGLPLGRAG